jgi:hypothetical protein
MNNMFSPTSGANSAPQLIPAGALHFAVFHTKEVKKSNNTGGTYARVELGLIDGPHEGRKIWSIVMNPLDPLNVNAQKRSEGKPDGANMGLTALTRMLEAARIFDPANPESYKKFNGASFENILEALEGQKVAIKIKISKGSEGYDDKNEVGEYLSPNPGSGGHKGWQTLVGGTGTVAQARQNAFMNEAPAVAVKKSTAGSPNWLQKPNAPF